jgi:curved DNA-binding protein CbpA
MHDALEYYKTLQISQDADNESIKQSYRDLAKKWHPDYNREQSSTDIFQQISVAYDVLSNPQSRLIYDIMSLVYDKSSYPDIDVITPIKDNDDGVNVRAVNLQEVKSWICGYKTNKIFNPIPIIPKTI